MRKTWLALFVILNLACDANTKIEDVEVKGGIKLGIDDVIRGCAIPPNMCDELIQLSSEQTLQDEQFIHAINFICPTSKCTACDIIKRECPECENAIKLCNNGLIGCSCSKMCKLISTISTEQLLGMCIMYPLSMNQDNCSDPSVGQCTTTFSWDGCDSVQLTDCEYMQCMREIKDEPTCITKEPSLACKKVSHCITMEENG